MGAVFVFVLPERWGMCATDGWGMCDCLSMWRYLSPCFSVTDSITMILLSTDQAKRGEEASVDVPQYTKLLILMMPRTTCNFLLLRRPSATSTFIHAKQTVTQLPFIPST